MAIENRAKRIQLFRNGEPAADMDIILKQWGVKYESQDLRDTEILKTLKDGEQILGRYKKNIGTPGSPKYETHTLYGVAHIVYNTVTEGQPTIDVANSYIEVFKNAAEIDSAIQALDVDDKAVECQYVSEVDQTDGKIKVTRVDLPVKGITDKAETKVDSKFETTGKITINGEISVITGVKLDTTDTKNIITPTQRTIKSSDSSIKIDNKDNDINVTVSEVVYDKVLDNITKGDGIKVEKTPKEGDSDSVKISVDYNKSDFKIDESETDTKGQLMAVPYTAKDESITIDNKEVNVNLADTKVLDLKGQTTSENDNILHLKNNAGTQNGLYAHLEIMDTTLVEPNVEANTLKRYNLIDSDNGKSLGVPIIIPRDQSLINVTLVEKAPTSGEIIQTEEPVAQDDWKEGQFLRFQYHLADNTTKWVYLDVSEFLKQTEFKDGLQVNPDGTVQAKLNEKGGLMFDTTSSEGTNKSIQINNDNKSILVNSDNGQVEVGTVDCGQY